MDKKAERNEKEKKNGSSDKPVVPYEKHTNKAYSLLINTKSKRSKRIRSTRCSIHVKYTVCAHRQTISHIRNGRIIYNFFFFLFLLLSVSIPLFRYSAVCLLDDVRFCVLFALHMHTTPQFMIVFVCIIAHECMNRCIRERERVRARLCVRLLSTGAEGML